MPSKECLIDEPSTPWSEVTRPDRIGRGFYQKSLSDGHDGRPYAVIGKQPAGFLNPAHFHTEPQFQVLLEGTVSFPKKPLAAVAVHYSDNSMPYGPFTVGEGMRLAVIRNREAKQYYMTDAEGRKLANGRGREFYGEAEKLHWDGVQGAPGLRRKLLFGEGSNQPKAEILEYPAGHIIRRGPAPCGRFEIVLKGSVAYGDRVIKPYTMIYELGDQWDPALKTSSDGATVLQLTFDLP